MMKSHSPKKLNSGLKDVPQESAKTNLLDEFPALPEKFFTFTHEMIAMLWMRESPETPIRGKRSRRK